MGDDASKAALEPMEGWRFDLQPIPIRLSAILALQLTLGHMKKPSTKGRLALSKKLQGQTKGSPAGYLEDG
jgi:hypothetical protein